MAKAIVDLNDVAAFRNVISTCISSCGNVCADFFEAVNSWQEEIGVESQKCDDLYQRIEAVLARLYQQLSNLNSQINACQSQLATTDMYIEVTRYDSEGEPYKELEINPEYVALQSQVSDLQRQQSAVMQKIEQIEPIQQQTAATLRMLETTSARLYELPSSSADCVLTAESSADRANHILSSILEVLAEYLSVSITGSAAFGGGLSGSAAAGALGYQTRINVTPINRGKWVAENGGKGVRGESKWCPDDPGAQQELQKFGLDGIMYKNGYPDFRPVAVACHTLNPDEFLLSDSDQKAICGKALLNQINSDPAFAKQCGFDQGQLSDLAHGKPPYGYVWHHDTSVPGLMLLVSLSIHQPCRHAGGRSTWGGGSKNR